MDIIIVPDYSVMSETAARLIADEMKDRPDLVLGLATGETPIGTYRELVRLYKKGELDFSETTSFNLDEYAGLSQDHPNSYHRFMWDNLFSHININPASAYIPRGDAPDPEEFCRWYEGKIKEAGGIDIQLLGIGRDGHIGFNEPGSSLDSRTRVVALDRQTIADNSRFFGKGEDVPCFAVTMGVGTILEARKILLLASGHKKAEMCAEFIEGPVTSRVTGSALQRHPSVTVFLDEEASAKLKRRNSCSVLKKTREEEDVT